MGEVEELLHVEGELESGARYREVITLTYTAIGITVLQDVRINDHHVEALVNLSDDTVKRLIASYRRGGPRKPRSKGARHDG